MNAHAKAPPPTMGRYENPFLTLMMNYPWTSPGNADACAYVATHKGAAADFHYCYLDVYKAFLRLGVCIPQACDPADLEVGLRAAFTKTYGMQLDSKLQLAPMTICDSPRFPYVAGTYVMIGVTWILLAMVAVGTALEWVSEIASSYPNQTNVATWYLNG
jgi:hypothetical protein